MTANPLDLSGRSILVTGASSGIGRATAILCSQLGAKVALLSRTEPNLSKVRDELHGEGHALIVGDVSQTESIDGLVAQAVASVGPLSGLVHSAGQSSLRPIRVQTIEEAEYIWRVNTQSALFLAKAFRVRGRCVSGSSIVLLSSVAGVVGSVSQTAYTSAKSALLGLTKTLGVELAREEIRANVIAPGMLADGMGEEFAQTSSADDVAALTAKHPLGLGTSQDIAHCAAFLLSDASRWITGTTVCVDGGYTAQ